MTISDRANSIENQLPEENPSNDMPQEVVIIITISIDIILIYHINIILRYITIITISINVISMIVSKHGPKEQMCQQEGWSGTI